MSCWSEICFSTSSDGFQESHMRRHNTTNQPSQQVSFLPSDPWPISHARPVKGQPLWPVIRYSGHSITSKAPCPSMEICMQILRLGFHGRKKWKEPVTLCATSLCRLLIPKDIASEVASSGVEWRVYACADLMLSRRRLPTAISRL